MAKVIAIEVGMPGPQGPSGSGEVATHVANQDNPHGTTKAQVGLGAVPNVDATARANHTGSQSAATISDFAAVVSSNTDVQNNTAHRARTDNPHGTTKAQVGLGSVDNTSDAGKPVSTAQQAALNAKAAVSKFREGVLPAHQSTSSATAVLIPDLSFAIGANESWQAEWYLNIGCAATGGVRFAINVPAGDAYPFRAMVEGNGITTDDPRRAHSYERGLFASVDGGGSVPVNFNARIGTNGMATIRFSVANGTTAGDVQLWFASAVAGQTSTVYNRSYFSARRVGA